MTLTSANYRSMRHRKQLYSFLLTALVGVLFFGAFSVAEDRNAGDFLSGFARILDFPSELVAEAAANARGLPALMVGFLPALIETLNIAITATLIGSIVAMLGAWFAAHGLMPSTLTVLIMRRIFDLLRAIPEIVVALVLIFVLGGGPVPAMIAIALHTIGSLGKLFAEINDNADLRPIQGLSATGASWFQTMWFGLLPQTMPGYFSYILLRLEVNIRASAILGFVGAGGIGYEFKNAITWGQGRYDDAAALFLMLFATIIILDAASGRIRKTLSEGA